ARYGRWISRKQSRSIPPLAGRLDQAARVLFPMRTLSVNPRRPLYRGADADQWSPIRQKAATSASAATNNTTGRRQKTERKLDSPLAQLSNDLRHALNREQDGCLPRLCPVFDAKR